MLAHLGARWNAPRGEFSRGVERGGGFIHRPHNSTTCTKQELRHVREYLVSAGVSLSQLQAGEQ
jgi:hypothetical protein